MDPYFLIYDGLVGLLILISAAGLIICCGWTSARLSEAMAGRARPWAGPAISFLAWTGFFAIGQAIHSHQLKLHEIALFALVPHLIVVAFGRHRFLAKRTDDRPYNIDPGERADGP